MSTYRHITNLQTPYDDTDTRFLASIADYKVGKPIVAVPVPDVPIVPRTYDELVAAGIVGIYTTENVVRSRTFRKMTGWVDPSKELGAEWSE